MINIRSTVSALDVCALYQEFYLEVRGNHSNTYWALPKYEKFTPGTVFRVSPDELSFASITSWTDIYGHKSEAEGKETHIKSDFYKMYGSGYNKLCIGSEEDPKKHSIMKRQLSPAFSTRALLDQEATIDACIDRFLSRIANVKDYLETGLDLTKWFEMFAFDLLGEMAFGESFHAVENGRLLRQIKWAGLHSPDHTTGKPHAWSEIITKHLFFVTVLDNVRRYPWLAKIGKRILPWATTAVRDKHSGYTRQQLEWFVTNTAGTHSKLKRR